MKPKKPRVVLHMGKKCPYYSLSAGGTVSHELRDIIVENLEKPINSKVAGTLDSIIDNAAKKLKKWAYAKYKIAKALRKNTLVFEKIIISPVKTTKQLALELIKKAEQ